MAEWAPAILVDQGQDIVVPRSGYLHQTETGLLPVDTVPALGVADDTSFALGPSPVEHAIDGSVTDHLVTEVEGAFPGPIRLQDEPR